MGKKISYEANLNELKMLIKSVDDQQRVRISVGNRIVANINAKLGQNPNEKLTDKESNQLINKLKRDYIRISDAYADARKNELLGIIQNNKKNSGIISTIFEYKLAEHYMKFLETEKDMVKTVSKTVLDFPIYTNYLANIKGIGPLSAAILIATLDPYRARHCSSFQACAGIDVVHIEDDKGNVVGIGRNNHKECLVTRKYLDKHGKEQEKLSITYNPFLKSKLLGVIVPNLIKAKNELYYPTYLDYKARQIEKYSTITGMKDGKPVREYQGGMTLRHIDNRAKRYAAKWFLNDLWNFWRKQENLPVTQPYEIAKLGHKEHGFNY